MRQESNDRRCANAGLAQPLASKSQVSALSAGANVRRQPRLRSASANTLATAVAGILYCASGTAYAQAQAAAAEKPPGTDSLEEIVVTATATGVKKLDASFNITAADIEEIKQENPKSTADILKLAPGIWPESSGGQTGANIEIAGIPGGGDAPFFTNMVNGSPLYGMPSLSFMDSSSLLRLDDTIERVEIVQGGPGAVFGPGQFGATANFILRTGTAKPTGSVGVTYGNEGLYRVDGFYGFPLTDGWYGSVGGFYRQSDGVRSPQFKADNGGQFTATVAHDLDHGSLVFWARTLDDKNQFIVPIPLVQNSNGDFSAYPGFDPLKSAYGSHAIQNVSLPNPAGGFENANLANGRGGNLNFFGVDFDEQFDDWHLQDKFLFDHGDLNTNALFSGPNPRPLSYYLYGCHVAQPAGYCSATNQAVDTNNLNGGQGYDPAVYNINANYVGGGAVGANQSVIQQGWWYIQKRLQSIVNDFRVGKTLFEGNTLTLGLYWTHYQDHDNWSLGNQMLMTNTPNATPITLSYVAPATVGPIIAGNTVHLTSAQGFVNDNGNYNIIEDGSATNIAGYLSDSWKLDQWLLDASVRVENIDVKQQTCNRTNQQLGTAYDVWDNAVPICNGTWDYESYKKTATTVTVGANYEFASNMSVYGRANNGTHFDDFDNGIRGAGGNFAPETKVKNVEVGFKYQSPMVYVDVSAYYKKFTGLQYTETNGQGVQIGKVSIYGSESKGIDFIGSLTPIPNLNLKLIGDYMDGHYTDYIGCANYVDINGNTRCISLNGAPLQRQPKIQFRFIPSYTFNASWGSVKPWLMYEHVGQRYEDQSGLQPLGTYYMLGGGVLANIGDNWEFRVQGTNLTNQIGLTEGNARVFGVNKGLGGVIMARPIEGREINFQAKYKF
jgi:outer membrane cobalamin receptor